MKIALARTVRELEKKAHAALKIAEPSLMEKASKLCADAVFAFKKAHKALKNYGIIVLAGRGNNGGDGILAGSYLSSVYGENVTIYSLCKISEMSDEVRRHFLSLPSNVSVKFIGDTLPVFSPDRPAIILDALLGIGFKGELRSPVKELIKSVNSSNFPVISIDVPSGIDCDSGVGKEAIFADMTVTVGAEKRGLYTADGRLHSGIVKFADIGFNLNAIPDNEVEFEVIPSNIIQQIFRRPREEFYKTRNGRVLIIGGSALYPGAMALSVLGADCVGCGLLTAAIKSRPFSPLPPTVIVRDLSENGKCFNAADCRILRDMAAKNDCIVFGMGTTANSNIRDVLELLLSLPQTLVLDADALNTIAMFPELWQKKTHSNIIITPHHQEAVRLAHAFDIKGFETMERHEQASILSKTLQCITVLKGAKTLIASPDNRIWVNPCGSYALAKGGSGDVLSGIIGALSAKKCGISLFEAAAAGVFLHAAGADFTAESNSVFDIAELPAAVRKYINSLTIF